MRDCLDRLTKYKGVTEKGWEHLAKLVGALVQLESLNELSSAGSYRKVRFSSLDASACPPPPRASSDIDAALSSTDDAIAALVIMTKAMDALAKTYSPNVRMALEDALGKTSHPACQIWHLLVCILFQNKWKQFF